MITFVCSILACMGSDELKVFLTALSGRDMKIRIAEFLQQEDCIAEAMDIAVRESGSEAFRAAWGISAIYETNRLWFLRYKDKFVSDFCRVNHHGVRREYGRIMLSMLKHKEYIPDRHSAENLAEIVCSWSIDPKITISEKVWTFSILKFLSRWVEWGEDMLQQLEDLCETDMSPGMRALMRRLRK